MRILSFLFSLLLLSQGVFAQTSKAFFNDQLEKSGTRLQAQLMKDYGKQTGKVEDLIRDAGLALNKSEAVQGLNFAERAAVLSPTLSQPWRVIARASLALEPKEQKNADKAITAAYRGYILANTPIEEALALSFLGQAYERINQYRQAISLLKMATTLDPRADLQKRYEEMREKYGFRVTGQTILSNQQTPSACINFSELLNEGGDYAPYVSITGQNKDIAISAKEKQLCVDGLKHGVRYMLTLRQGLPAANTADILLKTSDYQILVRDRVPTLRFTGRNYVLPSIGQQGLPIVSINADKIDVTLLRVNDRNLINTLKDGFLNDVESYSLKNMKEETGEKIWEGSLTVKSELNKEVITAIPVQEATGAMKPGVYLLTASPRSAFVKTDDSDDYERKATQWFIVSDMGLTSFVGNDGVHVLVRSLATAKPVSGATLQLIAKNNELLGTLTTDTMGYAKFDAGLSKGKGGLSPALITANVNADYAFLDIKTTALDFSGRGLKGRVEPANLDAFITTERGVYRGGENVHTTLLLRDAKTVAVPNLPLTVIIKRPDGMEFKREVVNDAGAGGRALTVQLVKGAPSGQWRIRAHLDPKQDPIGETTFLVEDYVPEKLDLTLTPSQQAIMNGKNTTIKMDVKYLYGAPAIDLMTEGTVTIKPSNMGAIPGFSGYIYGLLDEKFTTEAKEIEGMPKTDAQGKANVDLSAYTKSVRPLEAEVTLRAGEGGGRFISRSLTLPLLPESNVIAVKKYFKEGELEEGKQAEFDVINVSPEGKLTGGEATWALMKITNDYTWFFDDGRWVYEVNKKATRVADGKIALTTSAPVKISAPVSWGAYRLELRSGNKETTIPFSVGYEIERSNDAPDMVDVTLDKSDVQAGQKVKLSIASRFNGRASLVLMGDKLTILREFEISDKGTSLEIEAGKDWNTSNWLAVIAHRPLDTAAKRLPGRAIGLAHIAVDKQAKTLDVTINTPKIFRPNQTLSVPMKVNAGEDVFVTLAAVDVGILNLTKYQAPDPVTHYYGARIPGYATYDFYNLLIDGMQGAKGVLRQGGDQVAAKALDSDVPDNPPLAYFSGVMKADANGAITFNIPLPAFNGTVRLMATAWTKTKLGKASADVIVRDPIVMTFSAPRFLNYGDETRMLVSLHNLEAQAGDYTFVISPSSNLKMQEIKRVVKLAKGAKVDFSMPFSVTGVGKGIFDISLKGGDFSTAETKTISIYPSGSPISRRSVQQLAEGKSIIYSKDILADFVPETAKATLTVSQYQGFDKAALLAQLLSYPYACSEQTVSAAMPLLYVSGVDDEKERLNNAIAKLLSRQGSNGVFGLWSMPAADAESDVWLNAYITEFLLRAKEKGYAIPVSALESALNSLQNTLNDPIDKNTEGLAYAAYVTARGGRAVLGDLRYLNDAKLASFSSPLAKGHIAAALAVMGDRARATPTFAEAEKTAITFKDNDLSRPDYGSSLRDSAALIALIAENNGDSGQISRLTAQVSRLRDVRTTNTQENIRLLIAGTLLEKAQSTISLSVNDMPVTGTYASLLDLSKPTTVINTSKATVSASLTVAGVPIKPEAARAQGFKLERQIYTLDGKKAEVIKARIRYIVVLRATEIQPRFGRIMLSSPLPSGLEIENINLVEGAGLEAYPWLNLGDKPEFTETRDDRFLAAFERGADSTPTFSAAFIVRAVTPGVFANPASLLEDMYRPDRFATTASGSITITP